MDSKKFIESLDCEGISVLTDTGYQPIIASHKTIPFNIWDIKTSNGFELKCADEHILFKSNGDEIFVKDLMIGDMILTDDGIDTVSFIKETTDPVDMYDLSVDHPNHRYFTDGILSHNSTLNLDIISNAQKNGSKVLFISAEMNQVDLYLYVKRYPKFGDLNIFFPQELDESERISSTLENILDEGWDIILIDSLIELQDTIRQDSHMTSRAAEKYLLNLMYKNNLGENKERKFTSFLNIQQVNKGGVFVGSNKLKHMVTGMMEIRFVDEDTQEERYVVFSKNRRGHVGKQMYFDLSASGDVSYDTERFKKNEQIKELKKKEKEKIKESGKDFDKLFGLGNNDNELKDK